MIEKFFRIIRENIGENVCSIFSVCLQMKQKYERIERKPQYSVLFKRFDWQESFLLCLSRAARNGACIKRNIPKTETRCNSRDKINVVVIKFPSSWECRACVDYKSCTQKSSWKYSQLLDPDIKKIASLCLKLFWIF